jgi:serine/threonine protein kinase
MPLATGTRMGAYEILAAIGAGGMGEVYRARDTRLGREVAIKMLGSRFQVRVDGHERLIQEARAVSALNHPNILALYDICSENGSDFLVMELVRGKTLEQLIGKHGLAVNEAVKYAIAIADGLARAHAAGILHLDLKPSNIMITEDGVPKILDFGLAQAANPETHKNDDETQTLTAAAESVIAGTAGYMSPEQAEGKKLDARSDIFSFGAVLYEMVTGQRAFRGESTISTISAILHDDPKPPSQISSDIPRDLEKIIARCLRKDRDRRFQNMADVRVALLELREESESGKLPVTETPRRNKTPWLLAGFSAAVLIAAGISLAYWRSAVSQSAPDLVIVPFTSYAGYQSDPAFSPDGNQIAFAWTGEHGSTSHIYVKVIGTDTPLRLTSSEMNDSSPAWAPDGRSIAFIRAVSETVNAIYTVPPLGGPERRIAEIGGPVSMGDFSPSPMLNWSRDGKWLLTSARQSAGKPSRILAVSADTGEARALNFGYAGDEFSPALSPDSHRLAFCRQLGQMGMDIYTVGLSSGLRPTGAPRKLDLPHGFSGHPAWTPNGKEVIFVQSAGSPSTSRLWEARVNGDRPAQPIRSLSEGAFAPAVSPRGNGLAFQHMFANVDVWRIPISAMQKVGQLSALIASTREDIVRANAFSPDGRKIAFTSGRSGPHAVWIANADGSSPSLLFGGSEYLSGSPAWSPDGKWVAFDTRKDGNAQVYVISADGGDPRRLTHDSFDDMVPYWSHDGKWIYFGSNHGERFEIYKISPGGGPVLQVTHTGGWSAQESDDGRFLYYQRNRGGDGPLLRAPVQGGPEVQILPTVGERVWTVSGQRVWFIARARSGNELKFFDLKAQRVTSLAPLGENVFYGLAISPDQHTLLYNEVANRGTEILLVENFR